MVDLLRTPRTWPTVLLERASAADPLDLDAAVRDGAFDGLRRVIRNLGGTATIATIASAGLRGRGGAGFPTAVKWRTAAATDAPRRYVVVNGYGADPATGHGSLPARARPVRGRRGRGHRRLRDRRDRDDHRGPVRRDRGDPSTGGRHRGGRGCRLPRLRRARVRPRHRGPCPARPGRLHARRGDRAAQGARGQARPARAAPAAPGRARPVRHADRRQQRPDARGGALDHPPRRRGVRRDRRARHPRHDPRPGADAGARRDRRGPARDAAARGRRARREAAGGHAPSRRSSSAVRPAACCHPTCSTRRMPSSRCARPVPTSGRARSSSPTIAPASSTWPAS